MKSLFLLLLLTYIATAQNCPAYICNPPGMKWPDWVCGMEKPFNSSEYALKVGACTGDEYCSLSNWNNNPSTCESYSNQSQNDAYPGEPCNEQHECWGSNCVNNTCPAQPKFASCNNQNCAPGLTCLSGVCYPLSKVGGQCTQDSDCVPNAGCDIAQNAGAGVCVEYLSVAPHQEVQNCGGWGLSSNILCASTFCYYKQNSNNGLYYCSDVVQSASPIPTKCNGYNTCQSTADSVSGYSAQSNCQCGYDGFAYCGLFPGDAPMQAYLADVRKYLNSTAIHKCNTVRRPNNNSNSFLSYMNDWCAQATFKFSKSMIFDYYYVTNYQAVVNADRCVLKILQPAFYNVSRHEVRDFLSEEEAEEQ